MDYTNYSLPPEVEEGNIEYKLKLVNPTASRIEHLVTQMKWRLKEGQGEAIYEIGVEDCGAMSGLLKDELDSSLDTIHKMAARLDAEVTILQEYTIDYKDEPRYAVELLVKKIPESQEFLDMRIAVLGNVDAGKSTLLGVLGGGELDNGRGRARLNMFRHRHEIESGRTSSISQEILGYAPNGDILNYTDQSTAEDICSNASKIVTFIDLAGHYKYIKTTIFGLCGYAPEAVMLVVGGNTGIVGTTKEHLGLVVALKIPFLIVINKVDICTEANLNRLVCQLERILKSSACKKIPIVVNDEQDSSAAAANFPGGQITPIFKISNVTGLNLDLLRSFYFQLPSLKPAGQQEVLVQKPVEFQVDEIFSIPKVGPVLAGTLVNGVLREGDAVVLGPSNTGEFIPAKVTSIHRNRAPCRVALAGQTASVAVSYEDTEFAIRRGQVLLDPNSDTLTCKEFEAEIFLLFHTTQISKRFQATVHIGNVIQTAVVVSMNRDTLRTGQRAKIKFRFLCNPERIHVGSRVLLREGRTKGIGEVMQVFPYTPKDRNDSCCSVGSDIASTEVLDVVAL